ncbi:MAG: dehydrogenase [Nitrospinae bacterium]|nr:dehydrogenase [Nitrospinota bacterium]
MTHPRIAPRTRQAIRARAPLRLGLAGGGTDVSPYCDRYGGYVLNATIDRYAYAFIDHIEEDVVEFVALDHDCRWRGGADAPPENPILSLHWGVYRRIMDTFNGGRNLPLRLTTYSDAPAGSGLGSSSTLVVAMVQAFQELLSLPLGDYEIAHLAYVIERIDCGLEGGKQDQYAATFGGFNFMEFHPDDRVVINPLRIKQHVLAELEASLVLYYTGVSRDSASIIQEQSRNVSQGKAGAIEAMHEVKEEALILKEALLKGSFDTLAFSMRKGWESKKRMAHNISNQRIDTILHRATEVGATAGKVSGAGGGGFIMFLVDPVRRLDVVRALEAIPGGKLMMPFHFTDLGAQSWRF